MSNSWVQVPPNSTGTKMQTYENVVGINTVDSEAVTLTRSSDNTEVGTSAQPLRVDPVGTTAQPVTGSVGVTNASLDGTTLATIDGDIKSNVTLHAGTNIISKVSQDTSPWVVSGNINTKTALTPASPTAANVGVTSASAVAVNASRKGLILVNTSANVISLGLGNAAVLYSGITLSSGGSFEMDEYSFTTAAVYAIASGATSNLGIQEFST